MLSPQEEPKQKAEIFHALLVIFIVSLKPSIAGARPWCRFKRRAIDVRSLGSTPTRHLHASRLPSRRSLRPRPPCSCFDPNSSPKIFDKLPVCSTRGSCFQRKSSLSHQNSRSFQGSSWFLQFSRPFQDLENGFRNSSTFQGFQGPYAPCMQAQDVAAEFYFCCRSGDMDFYATNVTQILKSEGTKSKKKKKKKNPKEISAFIYLQVLKACAFLWYTTYTDTRDPQLFALKKPFLPQWHTVVEPQKTLMGRT